MAYSKEFMEYLADQLAGAGTVRYRLMFGAYSVYVDGKLIGIAGEDTFFVKDTPAGRAVVPDAPLIPPYDGAKPYIFVENVDDRDTLCALVRATCAAL